MFGLGFWELVVIAVVVILFVKPTDLPRFLRSLGRTYKRFKDLYRGVTRIISDASMGFNEPMEKLKQSMQTDLKTGTQNGLKTNPTPDLEGDKISTHNQSNEKEGS